eukprot:scaffold47134_cov36-Phaeocystis_antarctica.AAC.2
MSGAAGVRAAAAGEAAAGETRRMGDATSAPAAGPSIRAAESISRTRLQTSRHPREICGEDASSCR